MKNTHGKENEVKEGQSDHYLIEFVERFEFKSAAMDEERQKGASECKTLPNSREFQPWYPRFKHVAISRLAIEHADFFIPKELTVSKKLRPLMASLLFLEHLRAF